MRIFVSSSFEDLKDHRAAAIRVLRQLGHEVIAMEDMTAGSLAPLAKVPAASRKGRCSGPDLDH